MELRGGYAETRSQTRERPRAARSPLLSLPALFCETRRARGRARGAAGAAGGHGVRRGCPRPRARVTTAVRAISTLTYLASHLFRNSYTVKC